MRLHPRAPSLDAQRRRRSGGVPVAVWAMLALAGGGWWLWRVVGRDLDQGSHLNAMHDELAHPAAPEPATKRQATPGGPASVRAPLRGPSAAKWSTDPVAAALLAGAKDQLARKVAATSASVGDLRAASGNPFDLIERGLADQLPLRSALVRHQQREAKLGPGRNPVRKTATVEQLLGFLQTYAQPVGVDGLLAGDIVFVQRRGGRAWPAIVSDVLDAEGQPLVITLDPADRVAREQPLAGFAFRHGFRLGVAEVTRIRATLGLTELQAASARVL